MNDLIEEIKNLIVKTLDLEDISPSDIETDAPLFDEGLGLDSIDALELGLALQKRYGFKINESAEDLQEHFRSVEALANFIKLNQPN